MRGTEKEKKSEQYVLQKRDKNADFRAKSLLLKEGQSKEIALYTTCSALPL